MNKSKKYIFTASIVLCLIFAIVISVNVFADVLSRRVNLKLDMTADKVFTLSDETINILKNLDTDINIYSLIPENSNDLYHYHIRGIIDKFADSSSRINYSVINAEKNPDFISNYRLNGKALNTNCIIFESNKRYKVVDVYNALEGYKETTYTKAEKMFLSAIINVVSRNDVKIGVVTGHGEEYNSNYFNELLVASGYYAVDVDLRNQDIPDDVTMLVITTPETDYDNSELAKLDAFFENGYSVQVFLSPHISTDSLFAAYLHEWGIEIIPELIIENNEQFNYDHSSEKIIAQMNPDHDITRDIYARNMITLLEKSCGFETNSSQYITENVLLTTTESGSVSGKTSVQKRYNLASVIEKRDENGDVKMKMFICGSHSLLNMDSEYFNQVANGDLYNNVISYLADNEEYITIRPKNIAPPYIALTSSQVDLYRMLVVFIIPVSIIVFGIFVWVRRRRL